MRQSPHSVFSRMIKASVVSKGMAWGVIRQLGCSLWRPFHTHSQKQVGLIFRDAKGEKKVTADVGSNLLDVAHQNDIPLEGACEGACACATCHVIMNPSQYAKLPPPSEDELDMLDLISGLGLTESSRLGCQVKVTADMNNTTIDLPSSRNVYVDGFVPKPH